MSILQKWIAHIDIDPAEIGKNIKTDFACVDDIKAVLEYANSKAKPSRSTSWINKIQENKSKFPLRYNNSDTELCSAERRECISHGSEWNNIRPNDNGGF